MKKIILILSLVSVNAFAVDMTAVKGLGTKAMEKGKDVVSACKNEQMMYCKAYTEIAPLKECLEKNKEKLSAGCKASMGI